jgi:hypothetical protein
VNGNRVIRFATAAVVCAVAAFAAVVLLPHLRAGPGARPGRHGGPAAWSGRLKDPDGTLLAFGLRSWNDFAADVKAGRFDLI